MDHWDPALTDGLAANRPVILFDNTGVAGSSGQTPDTVEAQADNAAAFIHALGLTHVDVKGATYPPIELRHPELVRRLVLVGTKPRAGDDRDRHPDVNYVATRNEVLSLSRTSVSYSSYRRRPAKPRVNDSGSAPPSTDDARGSAHIQAVDVGPGSRDRRLEAATW
jgi:pimeloyl-ACP methyl ester carboxylesterase